MDVFLIETDPHENRWDAVGILASVQDPTVITNAGTPA